MGIGDLVLTALFVMSIVFVVLFILLILIKLFTAVVKMIETAGNKEEDTSVNAKAQ